MKIWIATLVCVACHSKGSPLPAPAPSQSTTPAASTARATIDAATKPAIPTPREVADRWNAAHVAHDTTALASLYGARVDFYGQELTNKECVARKKAAFEKSPDYTQSLSDVWTRADDAGPAPFIVVGFTKTTRSGGATHDYKAALFVDPSGLIIRESDQVTDDNLARAEAKAETWCVDWSEGMAAPTDHVIPPFKIGALRAVIAAQRTQYFARLEASLPGDALMVDDVGCPTKCDQAKRNCGYSLRVRDYSRIGMNPSILVDWIYVDAVDGVLIWDDGGKEKREPLPDD